MPPPISTIGRWPALLQMAQQHDLHQAADVQAVGGGIEADVGRNDAGIAACASSPAASVIWWM